MIFVFSARLLDSLGPSVLRQVTILLSVLMAGGSHCVGGDALHPRFCFHALAVVNSALVNTGVRVFFKVEFPLSDICLVNDVAESYGK